MTLAETIANVFHVPIATAVHAIERSGGVGNRDGIKALMKALNRHANKQQTGDGE